MKAVVIKELGKVELVDRDEQPMRPDYIKIKTVAVALNPSDTLHADGVGLPGGLLGCDVSGVVIEVGQACQTEVKAGDRVFGVCHCANPDNDGDGAFAECAMLKDGLLAKIPSYMSFEEAATLGVGITTISQALYMSLKLPLPTSPTQTPFPILIYGGSTATGTLAIQYAKMSGLTVITTASPKNFELVKSYGADAVFDFHDPECGEKIRKQTDNSLRYVLDCISLPPSFKICAEAFSSDSSQELQLATLIPIFPFPREDVVNHQIIGYTAIGEGFTKFGQTFPPMKGRLDYGVMFWKLSEELLVERKLKTHPMDVRERGLQGISDGIDDLREGRVSATKLVYRTADTPGIGKS